MEQTKKMSQSQALAKIKKFEKRNPGNHEIPFVLCKVMKGINRNKMSTWKGNPLVKIIHPIPEGVRWVGYYFSTPRKWEYAQDFHYDSGLRMLRISFLKIDAHWGAGMDRDWIRIDPSYYVDIDTCDVYDQTGTMLSRKDSYFTVYYSGGEEQRRWESAYMSRDPADPILCQILNAMLVDNPLLLNNMREYDRKELNNGSCNSWAIMWALRKMPKQPKTKKTERDLEIEHFHEECKGDPVRMHNGGYSGRRVYGYSFDVIYTTEEYAKYKNRKTYLIRIYNIPTRWEGTFLVASSDIATETARIYFNNKSSTCFKYVDRTSYGGKTVWEHVPGPIYYTGYMADFQNYKNDTFCSEKISKAKIGPADVARIAKNKYAEQLAAIGCYSVAASLADVYGSVNMLYTQFRSNASDAKGKTVFQWLKITPEQVRMIDKYRIETEERSSYRRSNNIVGILKEIFDDQLSSYGNAIEKAIPYANDPPYSIIAPYVALVKRMCKIDATVQTQLVKDTACMLSRIAIDENGVPFDWHKEIKEIKSDNDLMNLHNRCVRIQNVLAARRRANADQVDREEEANYVAKFLPKLKKTYEYENEHFMIVVPKRRVDIVTEGECLHHCVAGYAVRHIRRTTTILFVRKKEAPDAPFYTIEVDVNNVVVQVHGMFNKWIGNDPDAARFVWHWAKDKGVRLDDRIVLNTGTGYVRSAKYLPASELY